MRTTFLSLLTIICLTLFFSHVIGCSDDDANKNNVVNGDNLDKNNPEGCQTNAECPAGQECKDGACIEPGGLDCEDDGKVEVNGACVDCATTADCKFGTICNESNACVPDPTICEQIADCVVQPEITILNQGVSVQLGTMAKHQIGKIIEDCALTWSSENESIVTVDEGGIVTGGNQTGVAKVTATFTVSEKTCEGTVRNYATNSLGTRVVVVNASTYEPITGVKVVVGDNSVDTDADGIALFSDADGSSSVSVSAFKEGYQFHTVMGVTETDLLFELPKNSNSEMAGGFKGAFNFDEVHMQGEVKLGFAGCSLNKNLLNIDLNTLLGETVETHISFGALNEDVGLPTGVVLGLASDDIKPNYEAICEEGRRFGWGIGGKIKAAKLLEALDPVINGSDLDIASIFATVVTLLAGLDHSTTDLGTIEAIEKVADVADADANEDTEELRADFASFPTSDMILNQRLSNESIIKMPALPHKAGSTTEWADGAIVLATVNAPNVGIIPVGLTAGMDSYDENPNGTITPTEASGGDEGTLPITYAPSEGLLSGGEYAYVALSLPFESFGSIGGIGGGDETDEASEEIPVMLSGVVKVSEEHLETVDFGASQFMDFPVNAKWNVTTRTFTFPDLDVDYWVISFIGSSDAGTWQVFVPSGEATLALPNVPDGVIDNRTSGNFNVVGVKGSKSLNELVSFNDTNMGDFAMTVNIFSSLTCEADKPNSYCAVE